MFTAQYFLLQHILKLTETTIPFIIFTKNKKYLRYILVELL